MPGDGDSLETLLRIHKFVLDEDQTGVGDVVFDRNVLEELIERASKLETKAELPKTGRRAAIEAQKARKKNAPT